MMGVRWQENIYGGGGPKTEMARVLEHQVHCIYIVAECYNDYILHLDYHD